MVQLRRRNDKWSVTMNEKITPQVVAVSEIDYGVVINELSLQVANYARDNAILKSVIKSLQDQLTAQK
jgi:hypothetical protein